MIILPILLFSLCQAGSFGAENVRDFDSPPTGGMNLKFLNDINGDGIPEFLTSEPDASLSGLSLNGRLEVISGSTGMPLITISGQSNTLRLGESILPIDDINGDGIQDFLASTGDARVFAYSGATFSILYQTSFGWNPNYSTQSVLTIMDDVDGDLVADFALSDYLVQTSNGDGGAITIFSGASGDLIWSLEGVSLSNHGIGDASVSTSDNNGDGIDDLVVSSKVDIACYSGSSGALLWSVPYPGPIPFDTTLASIEDVNGDGFSDIAEGDRYSNQVSVLSGVDGTTLYTVPSLSRDFQFGYSLLSVGDMDGDGAGDFLAGSPEARFNGRLTGWIYLISGAQGVRIGGFPGREDYLYSGSRNWLLNAGDWTGDGAPEWATVFQPGSGQPNSILSIQRFMPPLSFQITGTCPGPVTFDISGGSPNARLGVALGLGGSYLLPDGPAEELELGTGTPLYRALPRFDNNGNSLISPTLPAAVCGLKIQAFDISTRATSMVLTL